MWIFNVSNEFWSHSWKFLLIASKSVFWYKFSSSKSIKPNIDYCHGNFVLQVLDSLKSLRDANMIHQEINGPNYMMVRQHGRNFVDIFLRPFFHWIFDCLGTMRCKLKDFGYAHQKSERVLITEYLYGLMVPSGYNNMQSVPPEISFSSPRFGPLEYSYDLWGAGVALFNTYMRLTGGKDFYESVEGKFTNQVSSFFEFPTTEADAQTHLTKQINALENSNFHISPFAKVAAQALLTWDPSDRDARYHKIQKLVAIAQDAFHESPKDKKVAKHIVSQSRRKGWEYMTFVTNVSCWNVWKRENFINIWLWGTQNFKNGTPRKCIIYKFLLFACI